MSIDNTNDRPVGETVLASRVGEWLTEQPEGLSTTEGPSKPCASCDDPDGSNWLLLTVEWEEYLCDQYGVEPADGKCHVPLCSRCRSWAEMLEIGEMNLGGHDDAEREQIVAERNEFLDSLRVELVANLDVSEKLTGFD